MVCYNVSVILLVTGIIDVSDWSKEHVDELQDLVKRAEQEILTRLCNLSPTRLCVTTGCRHRLNACTSHYMMRSTSRGWHERCFAQPTTLKPRFKRYHVASMTTSSRLLASSKALLQQSSYSCALSPRNSVNGFSCDELHS